jgi:hypothetical protein
MTPKQYIGFLIETYTKRIGNLNYFLDNNRSDPEFEMQKVRRNDLIGIVDDLKGLYEAML